MRLGVGERWVPAWAALTVVVMSVRAHHRRLRRGRRGQRRRRPTPPAAPVLRPTTTTASSSATTAAASSAPATAACSIPHVERPGVSAADTRLGRSRLPPLSPTGAPAGWARGPSSTPASNSNAPRPRGQGHLAGTPPTWSASATPRSGRKAATWVATSSPPTSTASARSAWPTSRPSSPSAPTPSAPAHQSKSRRAVLRPPRTGVPASTTRWRTGRGSINLSLGGPTPLGPDSRPRCSDAVGRVSWPCSAGKTTAPQSRVARHVCGRPRYPGLGAGGGRDGRDRRAGQLLRHGRKAAAGTWSRRVQHHRQLQSVERLTPASPAPPSRPPTRLGRWRCCCRPSPT